MLSICAARLRTRLGRVPASIFRTQTKRSLSTGKPTSNSKLYVAIAASGASILAALWWLNTTRDDVPYLENVSTEHLLIEPGPDEEQVSRILSQDSQSFLGRDVAGITRYYCAQLASNNPCEDRLIHGKFDAPWDDAKQWMVWAVFDGHVGSQTAELLKNQLLSFVRHDLSKLKSLSNTGSVPETFIQRAINDGFVNLDDSIIKSASRVGQSEESLKDKVKKLAPAWSGSCALLSLYDPVTGTLHVACTGDSRAVLGQKGPDGKWEATPLSVDQTGRNNEEIARICKAHPGEEDIIKKRACVRDRGFKSLWRWSMEVVFGLPAGCSAQILWSSSLDTKVRRANTPISDCRISRDKYQD
jgi:pyruvate dehydrogenase phosphatase